MSKKATKDWTRNLPSGVSYPIRVNFVVSKDLSSKIFHDIFKRYINFDKNYLDVVISETPVHSADVYHYHRPHLEETLKAPAVVTVHHDTRDIDPWLEPQKFWNVYRQTAMIVCLNSFQKADLAALNMHNTCIIPHGFDTKVFSRRLKTFDSAKKLNFGVVSKRYDRRFKGDAYLFELADEISTQRVKFTLVGASRTQDAARLRDLGFEVDVFEYLPYRLFGDLYHCMDFLLMTSTYEGGPANLPEALASSTPILCTNVGMVPDLIDDGKNGLILSGDIREDIDSINRIIDNVDGVTDSLFIGCHKSTSAISWEDVIIEHINMYADIVSEKHLADA